MTAETYDIKQFSALYGKSERTVREHIKLKLVPKPIDRKKQNQTILWRKCDVNKFLGIEGETAANDESPTKTRDEELEALVDAAVEKKLNELMPQLTQLAKQI